MENGNTMPAYHDHAEELAAKIASGEFDAEFLEPSEVKAYCDILRFSQTEDMLDKLTDGLLENEIISSEDIGNILFTLGTMQNTDEGVRFAIDLKFEDTLKGFFGSANEKKYMQNTLDGQSLFLHLSERGASAYVRVLAWQRLKGPRDAISEAFKISETLSKAQDANAGAAKGKAIPAKTDYIM
jgi:hypothetical protein